MQGGPISADCTSKIYLIGSLRNPKIPHIANQLRAAGHEVFDDWFAAGPEADDKWQEYETTRRRIYQEALQGEAAWHTFNFDLRFLRWSDTVVLIMPAGKSSHIELGWGIGQGKRGFVLFEKVPERWDVMYRFADAVFFDVRDLIKEL